MPELPVVEAARRAIEEHCLGKKIKRSIVADNSKVIDGVKPSDFQASLLGKTIVAAHRKGRNMWIQLDSPPFPSFQFGKKIEFISAGGRTTAYVPELQKINGTQALKAPGKPKRKTSKRSRGEDEDVDEPANEEEGNTGSVKSKKGQNPEGVELTSFQQKESQRKVMIMVVMMLMMMVMMTMMMKMTTTMESGRRKEAR